MAQQMTPVDSDRQITDYILQVGEDMLQPIASGSFTPNGSNNTINVPMRPVGLTRGFLVKLTGTTANSGSGAASLTSYGPANLLSNVVMTDLDNYQRINTTGWHLNLLNTQKEGFPFGAALLAGAMDSPIGYGNNFSAISASATLAATSGTGTFSMYFWVPAAYGKRDLRGCIYTGVTNANGFLQFTINPNIGSASGDGTLAMYKGANTNVSLSNVTYTVYQNYVDQLPRYTSGPQRGQPILPPLSIRTQYRLVNTALSAINANQDFPIPFTNFQQFLSASIIYDNGGTLAAGTDINQWKLAAANTLQFFNIDPITQALRQRTGIKTDFPLGTYVFSFRDQPISTNQAGNVQLLLNASSAASGAQVLVGWESFADVQTVLGAQSLSAS